MGESRLSNNNVDGNVLNMNPDVQVCDATKAAQIFLRRVHKIF